MFLCPYKSFLLWHSNSRLSVVLYYWWRIRASCDLPPQKEDIALASPILRSEKRAPRPPPSIIDSIITFITKFGYFRMMQAAFGEERKTLGSSPHLTLELHKARQTRLVHGNHATFPIDIKGFTLNVPCALGSDT